MKDRISTKILENGAIRYGIYDEAGNLLRYEYIRPEDEPTEPGSAINKANLLPDAVATALGLTGNPQVKDALEKIRTLIDGNTTLANEKAKITTGSFVGNGSQTRMPIPEESGVLLISSSTQADSQRGVVFWGSGFAYGFKSPVSQNNSSTVDLSTFWVNVLNWSDTKELIFNSHFKTSGVTYNYIKIA